ncbi:hybrid sensor histidine kinase/response regulator [Hyalangium versicolor]|uniref:hybrid sensor histidine kinase/response regulator n=1 Tax=Hyalangium versicolor TaxID=2861190 RepID=UPI001CCCF4C6|nr:ATP-binding protein [Hyalangium versicolor]
MPQQGSRLRLSELAEQGALALRRQIHDLFALLDLPAHWRDREPREIAESFIEVIVQLLRLDVALIRIHDPEGAIEQHFPSELDGAALLSAVQGSPGSPPTLFRLPRPNTVGRSEARVVSASPLGEQGVVIVGSWRQNFPTAHELQLLETATNQAALAMQSSREARAQRCLVEERGRLERMNLTLARLHKLSDGLSRTHTSQQVADVILSQGMAAVGAQAGSVFLLDETHSELRSVPGTKPDDSSPQAPRRIPVKAQVPLAEFFRNKHAHILVLPEGASPECYGLPPTGSKMAALVPLVVDDQGLGILSLGFTEVRTISEDEHAFIQAIAQQTAQACDRARLLEAEHRARLEAEARQQRADFLSEASAILGASLDFEEALSWIARLVVPRFADWVLLQVAASPSSGTEEPRTVVVHRDDSRTHRAREYGRSLLAAGGELRPRLTNHSVLAPIAGRGCPLGVVIFGTEQPGVYGAETLAMVEEFGFRAGVALEHARLFAAAREADRRKDEFLAMLGHELRNPLSPILTALQLMRQKEPEAMPRERTIIERQVDHMVRLVDDLLDVSRITRGKIQLKRGLVDTLGIVTKAVEMTAPLLEQHAHHLELDLPEAPLFVEGDEARLAQVVANLLNNAAKYTEPGGWIHVSVMNEGEQAVLRVRDSGTGISPEMLPRVFEMFVQDGRAIDRSQGGLGLGLAIVRSMVELHGGTVSAHSEGTGRGSEFMVRLPLAKPYSTGSRAEPASALSHPPVFSTFPTLRILLVDDNRDAAEMLAEALRMMGFVTHTASDGPSGLEAALAFRPDVALLDIGLPVMDGYELAERLRAHADLPDLKLIALTGYGQESDRNRARQAGFDLHLVKPVNLEHLRRELRGLLEARDRHAS